MNDAVNNFNRYFVSIVPKLAEKICDPGTADGWKETIISRNSNSMFLSAVEEREIIYIVNKCENKVWTDCGGIDMATV